MLLSFSTPGISDTELIRGPAPISQSSGNRGCKEIAISDVVPVLQNQSGLRMGRPAAVSTFPRRCVAKPGQSCGSWQERPQAPGRAVPSCCRCSGSSRDRCFNQAQPELLPEHSPAPDHGPWSPDCLHSLGCGHGHCRWRERGCSADTVQSPHCCAALGSVTVSVANGQTSPLLVSDSVGTS